MFSHLVQPCFTLSPPSSAQSHGSGSGGDLSLSLFSPFHLPLSRNWGLKGGVGAEETFLPGWEDYNPAYVAKARC